MKKTAFTILCVYSAASWVSAYIDPGTGGMIVGGLGGAVWPIIAAFFAGVAGFVWKFFKPISEGFKSLWARVSGKK